MPKIVDHAARRREILEQCFGLFADRGYAALSMRGIARSLGVTTGTLYYYFDSKEALFADMVRQVAARDVAEVVAEIPTTAPRSERLANVMAFVQRNAAPLLQTLQVTMEFHRQQGPAAAQPLVHSTLSLYREALAEQLHLTASESSVALSVLLGALVQLHLDPVAVDAQAHFQALDRMLR